MGIPDHLTCLLRNLYASQEATVRTGHGTTDWFQIRKGVHQGCILSPCLFNSYAEYIMRNAGLEEAQAGIKIARRNITEVMGELSHFLTMKSTYLHLNSSSSEGNPPTLFSDPHFLTLITKLLATLLLLLTSHLAYYPSCCFKDM